jgi:hypothetical protein
MNSTGAYGLHWSDTWIVFLGSSDSTGLTRSPITTTTNFCSNTIRFDQGQASPLPFFHQENACGIV